MNKKMTRAELVSKERKDKKQRQERYVEEFLSDLSAHILIVGGILPSEEIRRMSVEDILNTIYPNGLRLAIINMRMKDEYSRVSWPSYASVE